MAPCCGQCGKDKRHASRQALSAAQGAEQAWRDARGEEGRAVLARACHECANRSAANNDAWRRRAGSAWRVVAEAPPPRCEEAQHQAVRVRRRARAERGGCNV